MTESELREIEERWANATPGPWHTGGPVTRKSITAPLTLAPYGNGLSAEVWEVGRRGQQFAPGIAVVNHSSSDDGSEVTEAEPNAIAIAAAPTDIADLIAEVRRLKAQLQQTSEVK